MTSSHPSDDIASNIDTLFTPPGVGDDLVKQQRVDDVVAAAKTFAQAIVTLVPDPCSDRQEALVDVRRACDRAVSSIVHEPDPGPPIPGPEF